MDEHTLLWAMLPKGLEPYFEIEEFKEDNEILKIVLLEKNIVPEELGEKYHGKKIINTVIKPITVDYFPIKGKKCEIVLKRRFWKFDGEAEMLKREINICAKGTKLEKEFADFLKEFD